MGEVKRIIGNTMAQGAGRGVVLATSLATTALLTRYLGPRGYGVYVFVTAMVLLFGAVADWGTNIITVREAAAEREREGELFGSLTLVRLGLAFLALVGVNLVVRVVPNWKEVVVPVTVGAAVLIFLSLKTSAGMVFHARLKLGWQAVVEVVGAVTFLMLVVGWMRWEGGGVTGVLAGWVIATGMAAGVGWMVVRRWVKMEWRIEWLLVRRVVREALPTGALLLLFSIYNRIDILILEHFWGEGAVGLYGLSYKVHDNLVLPAAYLMNSIFPGLTRRYAKGERGDLKGRYGKLLGILFLTGLGVAGTVWGLASWVIGLLGGVEFSGAVAPLRWLMGATVFSYLNHLTGYSLIAFGRQRVSLMIAILALGVNVGLNLWLVPTYSYMAAAGVTVVTEGLVFVLSSVAVMKVLRVKLRK